MTMRTISRTILALMLLSTPIFAADLINVAGVSNVAINGYDPVAFFTDAKPVNGSPFISATHQGAVYFFATEEHKKLFTLNPGKYAPQYGGFCAFGAALDALFPVDISTWQVRNDKLYLNLNHDILKKFNADFDGNVAKADKNWVGLVQKNGR
jgi:YHS domain-containing protein